MTSQDWKIAIVIGSLLLSMSTILVWADLIFRKSQNVVPEWKQGFIGTGLILGLASWLAALSLLIAAEFHLEVFGLPLVIIGLLLSPAALVLGAVTTTKAGILVGIAGLAQFCFWFMIMTIGSTAVL